MSIEAKIMISAVFQDEDTAKDRVSRLKKSLKSHGHELASALNELHPIENQGDYSDDGINVEEITRKKSVVTIYSYTYSSEEPIWFAKSIYKLGANKIYIRGFWDGHARNYYFLNGDKVSKNEYGGNKAKAAERSLIRAKLISCWHVGDIYESMGLVLETEDGDVIHHVGKGKLVESYYDPVAGGFDKSITVEFSAAIEQGKLDGKQVLFAKRPTKIVVHRN